MSLRERNKMNLMNLTGKTVALYDDRQKESIMVRVPKFRLSDVIDGAPDTVHPAFLIGGEEKECIYVSKYQNVVREERAYSLPGEDPAVLYSFQEAEQFCRNKGPGWHLMTSAEWAALALWSRKNDSLPRGNNAGGKDWSRPHEHGAVVSLSATVPEGEEGPALRTATGSGPASWSHDGTEEGVFDLNGNIWEMTAGLRLCDGVLEWIPDNDAAVCTLADGSWIRLDAKTLLPCENEKNCLSVRAACQSGEEETLIYAAAETVGLADPVAESRQTEADCPEAFAPFSKAAWDAARGIPGNLLQQLCLIPVSDTAYYTDAAWAVLRGVRYPIRGGYWVNREIAGIFAYGFYMTPQDRYFDVGFRCCYIED